MEPQTDKPLGKKIGEACGFIIGIAFTLAIVMIIFIGVAAWYKRVF